MASHSDPTSPDVSRRSIVKAAAALAATAPLAGEARAQAAEDGTQTAGSGAPLMAYVGTFSSPLRDVRPT